MVVFVVQASKMDGEQQYLGSIAFDLNAEVPVSEPYQKIPVLERPLSSEHCYYYVLTVLSRSYFLCQVLEATQIRVDPLGLLPC